MASHPDAMRTSGSMQSLKTATREPQKGAWIPWIFVGLFGIVLIANGALIYAAFSTWNGLAAQRSYDKGLAYNSNIEAQKRQEKLGWSHHLEPTRRGIEVSLSDQQDRPITGADIEARLERPNDASMDFDAVFRQTADNRYVLDMQGMAPGLWNVHLVATKGEDRLVVDERLIVPTNPATADGQAAISQPQSSHAGEDQKNGHD